MRKTGIHNFPAIHPFSHGKAAADALNDEAVRLDAKRASSRQSESSNTKTDEIEQICARTRRQTCGDLRRNCTAYDAQASCRSGPPKLMMNKPTESWLSVRSAIDLAKIVIMAMEHDIRDEAGFDPSRWGPGVPSLRSFRPQSDDKRSTMDFNGGDQMQQRSLPMSAKS